MKPSADQHQTINTLVQILRRINLSKNIESPEFYQYLEQELDSLDDILSIDEKVKLQHHMQEIYLIIRNHE